MFGKKKTEVTEKGDVQFEKNIKTLWIYTVLFCGFALILIIVSSVIQGKIDSEAEYYQDQYENAQTSSQSTIKNIQDENAALKKDLAAYKSENSKMLGEYEDDKVLLNNASEMIENAEYLILALDSLENNKKQDAKTFLAKVNPEMLSDTMQDVYDRLAKELKL